jgi:hypothetical protein
MTGRVLRLALAVLVLLAAGCADEAVAPTHTASPTASSEPTPSFVVQGVPSALPISDADFADFRAFAAQIAEAVSARDSSFFTNRGIEYITLCEGYDTPPECRGQPAGTKYEGIYAFDETSDAVPILSRDNFAGMLDNWWASASSSASDEYATGEPRLLGLARWDGNEALAIVGLIVDGSTVQRQLRIFRFIRIAGNEWALHVERRLPVTETMDWLSGTCAGCYDYFEPWQGATN